ncbi:MAG: hypothetical protein WBD36_05430 [Bacteroidota bacterium]
MKKGLFILSVCIMMFQLMSERSYAIPAFSRKYKTSCATCHVAFPKLNAFGEAFRRNGYQFPDGGDAAATKEDPVSLGAEGNKQAFPDAIWPSSIPGSVPLSVVAELEATYAPRETPKWNFGSLEGEVELLSAGTLGEDISFLGEMEVVDDAIEIERANIIFSNVLGGTTAMLNVKMGKFEPGIFSFSNLRRISPEYGITSKTLGDNNWSLETAQKGVEVNGVIGDGRLGYNVGLVEGRKNLANSDKDVYAHVNYKVGGMRLDGVVPSGTGASTGASQPWQDNSVTVGGFLYKGVATLDGSALSLANSIDEFTMIGGDINAWIDRLNLIGAVSVQSDKKPFVANPDSASTLTSFMAEASYMVYPWLVPLVRIENSNMKNAQLSDTRLISAIQFLIRANVRAALEFNFGTEPSETDPAKSEWKFNEFAFGITFGL